MACACRGRRQTSLYLWIPEGGSVDGEGTKTYDSEIVAKAKVTRSGGSYIAKPQTATRTAQG